MLTLGPVMQSRRKEQLQKCITITDSEGHVMLEAA